MNRMNCDREDQTSRAIHSGTIHPDIATHAQLCPACSDILLASRFLQAHATLSAHERTALADPTLIWRKAQRRATERALRLASRPIRWMTVLACVAFVCSPWLRLVLPLAQDLASSGSRALDFNLVSLSRIWPATTNQPLILLGGSGTMILLALSSWLILREE